MSAVLHNSQKPAATNKTSLDQLPVMKVYIFCDQYLVLSTVTMTSSKKLPFFRSQLSRLVQMIPLHAKIHYIQVNFAHLKSSYINIISFQRFLDDQLSEFVKDHRKLSEMLLS